MDAVQKQITILSHKVDALYQVIDQLSEKVTESLSEIRQLPKQNDHSTSTINARPYSYQSPSLMGSVMEHKDVLVDNNNDLTNHQSSEKTLSPDIQVQRLTAQLTAAYNRIAALEEQLLSRRIHS
jgi:peptidoglycan hydrolase CwlO-like protein